MGAGLQPADIFREGAHWHIGHTRSLTLSGVTDGGAEGRIAPPGKLNVKTGPPT